jgi:hypothetical protein
MITHVVLFKIAPDTPREKITSMTTALNALKNEIPQLLEMHAGINISPRSQGHEVMLVSRFNNTEDLRIYTDHPAHQKVILEAISPIRESVIVGDIES